MLFHILERAKNKIGANKMINFSLKYDVGEEVWDKITLKKTKIIGVEMKFGKKCCSDDAENYIRYYVETQMCNTYRLEKDLENVR